MNLLLIAFHRGHNDNFENYQQEKAYCHTQGSSRQLVYNVVLTGNMVHLNIVV